MPLSAEAKKAYNEKYYARNRERINALRVVKLIDSGKQHGIRESTAVKYQSKFTDDQMRLVKKKIIDKDPFLVSPLKDGHSPDKDGFSVKTTSWIYTLQLADGKYYVGRSTAPSQRILQHFENAGCEWTKVYKPIGIVSKVIGDEFDEEKHTLLAMDKYGIDNVRGGSYCRVKLSTYDKEKALQTIRSITDKCYKCGDKGHFSKECEEFRNRHRMEHNTKEDENPKPKDICIACNGSGESYWSDGVYGTLLPCLECLDL